MPRTAVRENKGLAVESDTFVDAFARGLSVIRAFEDERQGLTLSEVAQRAGFSPAGARRLLHTLVHLGYARIDNKRFFLTPLTLKLGFTYLSSLSFRELAQPLIDQFAKQMGEVCTLSVLDGVDVVYVVRADIRSPMTHGLSIGDRLPVHATSTGHMLMTGLSEESLNALLEQAPFERFTSKTLCEREELLKAVEITRTQGWSLASEQIELGVCGLAVPVFDDRDKVVAALAVSVNLARHSEAEILERFLPVLEETAGKLRGVA